MEVKVDIEYCGKCNFSGQCNLLKDFLIEKNPDLDVNCHVGRQGSFEVKINDTLVHSKMQSLAFPKYESVLENIRNAKKGIPLSKVEEQPIENCTLM